MRLTFILSMAGTCLAACATGPSNPASPVEEKVRRLIRELDSASPSAEERLAEIGEEALPGLTAAVRGAPSIRVRERAAAALGIMYERTRHPQALRSYVEAVTEAPAAFYARRLLGHAHRFRDPDGQVLALLNAAMMEMSEATPEMVAAAGTMTDVESTAAMMRVVAKAKSSAQSPERDLAVRYLGRAARRGRREALEFLRTCTMTNHPDLEEKAGRELSLMAGRLTPGAWGPWWLDHATRDRKEWLVEAFSLTFGKPLDLTDRAHIGELIERIPTDQDAEPEFWLLERTLGPRFGYVSPSDVFDPDVDRAALAEANRRAVETIKTWWRENSPYVYLNPATGLFEVNEEGRKIGVPVDPKTGRPGR
jgi:hypothetical protein